MIVFSCSCNMTSQEPSSPQNEMALRIINHIQRTGVNTRQGNQTKRESARIIDFATSGNLAYKVKKYSIPAKHPNRAGLGLNVEQCRVDTSATSKQSCNIHESHRQPVLQHSTSPAGNPTGKRGAGNQSYRQPKNRQPVQQETEPQATSH